MKEWRSLNTAPAAVMARALKREEMALAKGRTPRHRHSCESNAPPTSLEVNSCSWIRYHCSRCLVRRFSRGWLYIKIVTGMLMLSKLYVLAIFNLQIYIMLKLLVSRQLKRGDYKWWSAFIYTEYSRGNKGRRKIRQEESSKERRNKKEEGRRNTISGKQTDKEEITEKKPELETIYRHRTHYIFNY